MKADAVEMDEMCVSLGTKKNKVWLWLAVSRYTGQILSAALGNRSFETLERLYLGLPARYRYRLVYTDGYVVYAQFFSGWQHRLCEKGDGGTCTVEGVNNALRHRCPYLARRSSSVARSWGWLWARLLLVFNAHNQAGWKRLRRRNKRTKTTQSEK